MSHFVGYRNPPTDARVQFAPGGAQYIYDRAGKQCHITSGMLNSLFRTHGYCVDPTDRSCRALSSENIAQLEKLASENQDYVLLESIRCFSTGKVPSPRLTHDDVMQETTLNEKHRFDHLPEDKRRYIRNLLQKILEIGFYLIGWCGSEEPYPSTVRPITDIVRTELQILPLIESLYSDRQYPLIKNFPIISYQSSSHQDLSSHPHSYQSSNHPFSLKPSIRDTAFNINQCLDQIASGTTKDYQRMGVDLIATAYYYITTIGHTPLPMLDPIIRSISIYDPNYDPSLPGI